jgi:hypothetical protein
MAPYANVPTRPTNSSNALSERFIVFLLRVNRDFPGDGKPLQDQDYTHTLSKSQNRWNNARRTALHCERSCPEQFSAILIAKIRAKCGFGKILNVIVQKTERCETRPF